VISRAQDGIILDPSTISCAQQSITGTGDPVVSNKPLKYITSESGVEQDYTGTITLNGDWEWIEFRLYNDDILVDRERILILYQWVPASTYELVPSVSVIKHKYDDTIDPVSIICNQVKYTPGLPAEPSDKVIKYITSDSAIEQDYTGAITIEAAWTWIEFHLYDGASFVDIERIPVDYDGSDGIRR
jgi:hypothetical protein